MARVLISKATLADFGVPRQNTPVRQPMPTAEEIERVVRESDVALTPREFVNKVPLLDRKEVGTDERWGGVGADFGNKMGIEGSLAHGLAAREFPQIMDFDDPLAVPFIRDYYSRQSTLPEHFWDYHTEGPYYDEEGNILPGQVPPVNAVKVMSESDIRAMGNREGYGLKPVPFSDVNMEWEKTVGHRNRFPSKNIGFAGGFTQEDINRNAAGNVGGSLPKGVVAIRGFGRPQDKAFARGAVIEGAEGGFTAPIPPERLVGVMPRTRMTEQELKSGALKHLYDKESTWDEKLHTLVEQGEVSPMDAIYATIRRRAKEIDDFDLRESPIRADIYPQLHAITDTDAGKYHFNPVRPTNAENVQRLIARGWREALPAGWKEGVFGFENPILTDAEKESYLQDLQETENKRGIPEETPIREMEPSEMRTLYPTQAGVRFG